MRIRNLTGEYVSRLLPKRRKDSHKGENGRLMIIGGSEEFVGAPALAAFAALRSGIDLVIVAAPYGVAWTINMFSPDLITLKLPGKFLSKAGIRMALRKIEEFDTVLVGPGLGKRQETKSAVRDLLNELVEKKMPAIFDADALKAIPKDFRGLESWVLTPHAGEFRILAGEELPEDQRGRIESLQSLARKMGCTILLKAPKDILVSPSGDVAINPTGNPGMTVGGTGDVLSGIIGSMAAQGLKAFDAACVGAWICGRAGDRCFKERGFEFTASDVIEEIPGVFRKLRRLG
jgi:NAD(P)H-hydrate epimerase